MIRNASGSKYWDTVIPSDPRKIFPQPRKHFKWNEISSLFCAEDAMDENVGILVGHPANIHICCAHVCAGCHTRGVLSMEGTRDCAVCFPGMEMPGRLVRRPGSRRDGTYTRAKRNTIFPQRSVHLAALDRLRWLLRRMSEPCRP